MTDELVQRSYDGKWEQIRKIPDYENSYTYKNEQGIITTLVPDKWITVHVFDFITEIVE